MVDLFLQSAEFVSGCAFSEYVVSGIMAIMSSKVDSASPWKILLWIIEFSYASSSCCQLHSPGFHGLFDEV